MATLTKYLTGRISTTSAVDAAGAGAGVLLAAAVYCGVYLPLGYQSQWRLGRMDQLRSLVTASDGVIGDHERLDARLDELQAAADSTRDRIGPAGAVNDFIDAATSAAKKAGLDVTQVTASSPQADRQNVTIDVTCRATGSYASIVRFLAAVSQLTQISTVEKLDLAGGTILPQYPVEVVFRLYCLGEPHDIEN